MIFMKIYTITLFVLAYALSLTALNSMSIFDSEFQSFAVELDSIIDIMPDTIAYTDADVSLFQYGDFPKMLVTVGKLFIYAPRITGLSLSVIGCPAIIYNIIMVLLYVVYIVGIVQILGRLPMKGAE